MSEPFIGQINMTAFNFPPKGWARCDGQLLPIGQNQALFSLLGTMYGGDGRVNFALPDLRGRTPVHVSPDLVQGQALGAEGVSLTMAQMPAHTHQLNAGGDFAASSSPANALPAARQRGGPLLYTTTAGAAAVTMNPAVVGATGGGQPHLNMQPFMTLNYVIAIQGIFPSRN